MSYYLAPSLVKFRSEINERWPDRDKSTDGWIGDAAHSARVSQHNPDENGIVRAIDIDKDGIDPMEVVKAAIAHPATWYVIFDGHIWSRTHGFRKARYTGQNPHRSHIHVSIKLDAAAAKATAKWLKEQAKPKPKPAKPAGPKLDMTEDYKPGERTIKDGSKGEDVAYLQRWIGVKDDGVFGPVTLRNVKRYQKMQGLAADGIVGRQTWKKILG